ncbi:dynein axonemal heavy chain 8 [Anthonomus grandis grandis]|uniref:dynein axonemal heavy chain 8 n=1 Tax=Anthonomus grandis grandis TaxID=2921223 RepID=UPI0021655E7F|nr:dynein axonemal heavy chain 8 [Anthonomus grandis grandis]
MNEDKPPPSSPRDSDKGDVNALINITKAVGRGKSKASTTLLAIQETAREKQARFKEIRTTRYQELQLPQRHVCDMVSIYFGIEQNDVMEGAADEDSSIQLLNSIMDKDGTKTLLVYLQDGPPYPIESGRFNPALKPPVRRIYVTKGLHPDLTEKAIAVYKNKKITIDLKNITDELSFVMIDLAMAKGNMASIAYDIFGTLVDPLLKLSKDWGDLPKTAMGRMQKLNFIGDWEAFVEFLNKTKEDLSGIVTFNIDEELLKTLQDEDLKAKMYFNSEFTQRIESQVRVWHKLIERCLVQYNQIRRENEFVGPNVEVEYWRRQLTRFTSIVDFLEKDDSHIFINFLTAKRRSEIVKIWKRHVDSVYNNRNECSDNIKYLYSMEKYWEPFYRLEPPEIINHIPPLLNAVRLVFTTSRYYNSTGNVTAILVKVSNQIIKKCRDYLNCEGTTTVWNQPKKVVLDKIKTCLDVYLKYYQCFRRTQKQMEEAGEKPFECSESFIFGKFETFKKRCEQIVYVLETTIKYSILQASTIEGIDVFAKKFVDFFKTIMAQKYDALNHRLPYFDKDYNQFKQNVVDTEWELEEFVGASLEKMTDVDNILRLLKRFEKLDLACLHLEERYLEAMILFQYEIEKLRDRYNEDRQAPQVPNNMPPVTGRIYWIRQFYARIAEPMEIFKTKKRVMQHRKVQKCIQLFNAMSLCFVHYENIYHDAWYDFVAQVRHCLIKPIMTKDEKTRRYKVNFHPYIIESIREAEYMYKLNLAVPDVGQVLVFCKDKLLKSSEVVRALVDRNDTIRSTIPPLFLPMMRVQLLKIENAFMAGFSTITWTSTKIPEFCKEVTEVLDYIEMFVKAVKDMKEARIDEVLETIAVTPLVFLPNEPIAPSEFLQENIKYGHEVARELRLKSSTIEKSVKDLINTFLSVIEQPELQQNKYDWLDPEKAVKPIGSTSRLLTSADAAFKEMDRNVPLDLANIHSDCIEMFAYFNMKLTDALIKATKLSLEKIKLRATNIGEEWIPLMSTYMKLTIPIAIISPSLDEIQNHFSQVLQNILDVNKYIGLWGQEEMKSALKTDDQLKPKAKNYYKSVSENKEIVRVYMSLQGVLYLLNPDVASLLEKYLKWKYLWVEDRDKLIDEFCEKDPLIVEISEKFTEYDKRAEEIKQLPDKHDVGAISIFMEHLKMALLVESEAWKHIMGKNLSERYKKKLVTMVDFIKAQEKILNKPIKDLDDCRNAMICLATIRENFIEMDLDLSLMEEAYSTFGKYKIDTPKEDIERVESLRFNFQNMVNHSKAVQEDICEVQGPLLEELTNGVATFKEEVEQFDKDFEEKGPMIPGLSAREASDRVLVFQDRFDELWRRFEMYSSGEKLFGLEVNDYPILHQRKKEFTLLNKLYGLYLAVNHSIDGYFDILWSDVDTEIIFGELQEFQNRCRKLPKAMKDWPAFIDLKKKIDDFSETCPLLELMANKAMKDRHWKRLGNLTGYSFDVESPTFTLRSVMEAPLLKYKDDVEDICISAVKEKDIEAKLKQVIADWAVVELSFSNFKARGELLLKGQETGEIITTLEDSLMIMNSLLSNRYNAPFKKDIQLWVHKLVTTSEILEKWLIVQNLWVYLEAVFVGGDIAKQLPQEAKRFSNIDKSWIKIMLRAHEIPNAVECCTGDETMGQLLPHLLEQLETCQKSLTGYLESKRLCFPRFFFISDPVLLEILGQSSDPCSIQPHLLSLFDAVFSVDFDEKHTDTIVAMNSNLGEKVLFERGVVCQGGVEFWLNNLLSTVRETVKNVIAAQAQCFVDPDYDFISGFVTFCGQAGLVGVQLLWTKEAEVAIKRARVDRMAMKITNQRFLDLLNSLIDLTSKDLTKMQRTQYETMVTIHVHQRDIFDNICKLRIKSILDFEWQAQCRFYYNDENDDVLVKITDVIFLYQNEYLGITERLAITPLTDRCYITLAQAIWINMGGAPAGPAGTGKTETTKDMGRTLGKFVVVFNCSDQMDFRGLGRIFKGLAQSGTWGCFDEFNRIELPVLSVAAQQIYIVLQARKERKPVFVFMDGDNVSMNIEFGIFLTMNPGYAGRQELPENLKIMFRSVAMMVPDRQIIIRVKMASCGFKENVFLSRKFYTLYQLCEEQLSKQVHYDFGLRNILSVLRTLGAQKRSHPTDTEETIVMRVLRDMNLSKLIDEDEPLFLSLIEDMFPGIKLSVHSWKDLQKAIGNVCSDTGLVNFPSWNLKVIQLYETSLVRHGLMVLGPTGAGKTKCMHTLMKSMTETGLPHKELRMNPKAITAPQMFGRLDVSTNDWTDGIFSTLWRRTLKFKKTDYCWLVLDGPVDAVWIENLNSVLDDNKTLTLANGDRIVMAANCKLVFEPDNVDNASPATVSRMGMVFMSSSVLPWMPILDAWLKTRQQQEADSLRNIFAKCFGDLHTFVQTRLKAKMFIREALYIRQCYDVLQGILDISEEPKQWTDKQLERLYLFAVMWSLGALLELDDRAKLETFALAHPSKMDWPKCKENETIFEYVVNPETGKWEHWRQRVEEFVYPTDSVLEFTNILVPNVDNVRTAFLIHNTAKQNKAVLLIGEPGTAKTVMIKGYMSTFDPDYKLNKSFNFSSATTPNMVQRIIESYVDKRVGTTYGPPAGKTLTIFIDDINMPVINDWGDQITNEIVRQLMENGGFYSLDKPGDFSYIVDVMLLAAMIHPGGGRNDIPHRLKRQFCVFNCTLPSTTSMDLIFRQIGCGYFCIERFEEEIVEFLPKLIPLTRHIWQKTKQKMLPTPAKFHYVFNLRDLSRIWQGILTVQRLECKDKTQMLKLWRHECQRVISDRFTIIPDKKWFENLLKEQAREELEEDFEFYTEDETYWVDFLRDPPDATGDEPDDFDFSAPKIYEEIPSWEFLKEKLFMFMSEYNEAVRGSPMDMVFFHDAMVNLMIISRIIRTPKGNALLVGVGGSGKQSLTRLSSFMANYKSFQIQLTRSYNVNNLMDDMKQLYRVAGLEGTGMTFIFTDNEIKEETFLESINNILSSGEIANLFAKDELDEIQSELIPVMKKVLPKRPPTGDNLYDFFLTRSKQNLHVVLCFSPVGEKFRSRALKFPGLISGCTINWFQKWPQDALEEVSFHFLHQYEVIATPEVKTELILIMAEVHDGVADFCDKYYDRFRRRTYVTPKTFISYLAAYKVLYRKKVDDIDVLAMRMKTGLSKLVEAQASVDVLRAELAVKEKEMTVATEAAEKVLAEVMAASQVANKIKEEATVVKERAENLVSLISVDQKEAEAKLLAAKPALDAAESALQTIKASDIATVRKLGKPPYLILLIMDAVLIYFKRKMEPTKADPEKSFLVPSWADSLKVMADTTFLKKLQEYPKDTINSEMIDLLQPYFSHPLYTFEAAKTACGNVAGLIAWTIAMASFFDVNREVLPLKANLAIQQAKLTRAQEELQAAMELLAEKEAEVKACQDLYDEAMAKKQEIFEAAMKVKNKMDAATALIDGLAGERIRWTDQLAQFKAETERLIGDVVLLTGFLGYTGPFNQEFRNFMQHSWLDALTRRKIPVTTSLNIIDSLTDIATIGEWNLQGLPTDELSIQNGIIVTTATRYPLLIDPQSQGKAWVKNKEKTNHLIVTSLNNKYFRNHIEDAVSLGYPMIIEDISEELDPVLDNVMEKNHIKIGTTFKVKVGDKEVDVNDNFRLYITTKLANPMYTPEIFARASIIDFTVTMKGLEDQLLGRVILTEKQELETERTNLIKDVTANRRKMLELEQNLLYKLTTTKGSLLDDDTVIGVLNVTKNTAAEVREKLQIAKETETKINVAREEFRPIATRGSILYFLVVSMSMVNVMYQTSLVQFLERFDISMLRSEKTPIIQKRIQLIIDYLTYEIFKYQSRGLYECNKYMFVLLMCLNIDLDREHITHEEFQNFIKGGAALDMNACPPKPAKWITDLTWLNLVELSKLRHFQYIVQQVSANDKQWRTWFDKDAPEEAVIPDGYNSLDTFRRLLIIRAWCPDRTITQSRKYIANSLGQRFSEPVILNFEAMHEESRSLTPLICFLSMGSDPTPYIETLAKRLELKSKSISMGQGQEVHARKMLTQAMQEGFWALLQNCHLSLDYMNEVLGQFLDLEKGIGSVHPDFRLWITTEVHPKFPISLLQICIKFTNEAPQGIRAGLLRTYTSMNQDMLDYSDAWQYIPLVYAISFLHTVVQERRKFGPLGWNIPYEFNSADWLSSVLFLQNHLDDIDPKRGISWQTLRYMLGEVHYGGRVTDDFDKILLNTFCRVWFSDDVFKDDFLFYKGYKIVRFKQVSDYLAYIDGYPSTDPPQAYGLHSNADITYQTNTTIEMFDNMLSIQPKESGSGSGESRETTVGRQAKDMLSKLPKDYDPFEVKERLKAMNLLNPLNIFLRQEIDRMQKVISLVRSTLTDLLLAIDGIIIMSESLGDALDNIYDAKVPFIWRRGSWEANTLGFWFTELIERDAQFRSWCFGGRPPCFWMAGFFNPQGFLTAMKQEVARAHKGWALDQVSLMNQVTKNMKEEINSAPPEGVLIYGLFLDGAGWDRRHIRLAESINKVLYTMIPVVHVYAIYSTDPKPATLYTCPVYKKARRTGLNFITVLWLQTAKPPEHWVLRGVALLCDIQ